MAGVYAGSLAWRGNQVVLERNLGWDEYSARLLRYEMNELYYSNMAYDRANRYLTTLRRAGALYTHTRGIYNPVYRVVNIYADKIYPGTIDFETLETGAIPVMGEDVHKEALKQLFRWSNWNAEKQLYVRQGEKLGDVFIKVVDDTESRRVVLEVLEPQKVKYCKKDAAGNIEELWIEYPDADEDRPAIYNQSAPKRNTFVTTEVIKPDSVTIYRDGKQIDRWDNPYGFVPIVHAKPHDEGRLFGVPRWNIAKPKIDETNSQAALLNDQTRKSIIPYWKVKGGEIETNAIQRNADNIDEILTISLDDGVDIEPLVSNVNIEAALTNIQAQLEDIEKDIPELYLYNLFKTTPPSGVALRQMYDIPVTKINTAMGVYDDALNRACQMAMTIGGLGRYTNFEPFDLQSFARGDLNFTIKPRHVFYEGLDTNQKIEYLIQTKAPAEGVWDLMLVKDEDQAAWRRKMDADAERAIVVAGRANPNEEIETPMDDE